MFAKPSFDLATALTVAAVLLPTALQAQDQGDREALPSIQEHTEGMTKIDGFFPLYYEAEVDRLWMEVPHLNTEVLHLAGLAAGLGSNDIGLDRGSGSGSRIVEFERHGRRLMMVQPNYRFRANTDNPAEERAVRDRSARPTDPPSPTGDGGGSAWSATRRAGPRSPASPPTRTPRVRHRGGPRTVRPEA